MWVAQLAELVDYIRWHQVSTRLKASVEGLSMDISASTGHRNSDTASTDLTEVDPSNFFLELNERLKKMLD